MSYDDKAFDIVKESINSVVFIDEKAKDFYSFQPIDPAINEEQLSLDLYTNFKDNGINLIVHKFKPTDITNTATKKYLLKNRDLVLLDWELNGIGGEEFSLSLLSDIVEAPSINFCCIYTASSNFEVISKYINKYFSGYSKEDFNQIRDQFNYLDLATIDQIQAQLDLNIESSKIIEEYSIDIDSYPDFLYDKDKEPNSLLNLIVLSEKYISSIKRENQVFFGETQHSFIINNTYLFLLKKDIINDKNPNFLIKRISSELALGKNSFLQLLGLEMQTLFNNNESFINENLIKSSSEAFFKHRHNMEDDVAFSDLIKNIMIEHSSLKLRDNNLSILDKSFLDEMAKQYTELPSEDEIASLNTYYNSFQSVNKSSRRLNFGDVFIDDDESKYYMCITALCDCLRPERTKNNYYFVKGEKIEIDLANQLGDSAFISYLSSNIAVSWVYPDSPKKIKVNNDGITDEKIKQINNLKAKNSALEHFRYKPAYVQPLYFNVRNPDFENTIEISQIYSDKNLDHPDKRNIGLLNLKFITTIRPNYTQRIANHAFSHPIRVGVDFVSK